MKWVNYGSGVGSRFYSDNLKSTYCQVYKIRNDNDCEWAWCVNLPGCYIVQGTSRSVQAGKQACEKCIKDMINNLKEILS